MLYIKHATVLAPTRIEDGAVLTKGDRIVAVGPTDQISCPPGTDMIDASGMILAPGFIELQFNGGFGHDFTAEPTTIWQVAAQLPRYGVTAFLPTIITSPPETIALAQDVVTSKPTGFAGTTPLGLHVEGPFLNPEKKGAHNPNYLRLPNLEVMQDWTPERGIRLVTLAPELPGALEAIETLSARGIVVSSGHTMATFDQALAGFDAGTRYVTHLFNVMPSLHHRAPGLIGALFTDPRTVVGLIVDGIHTHPSIVDIAWKLLGNTRLNLVTDAMAAMGMLPGRYVLADLEVIVDETSARLPNGTLAGSILTLDAALRNLMRFTGCSLEDALPTVTTVPAKVLGMADERGRLAPGYLADMVLLTQDLRVGKTIVEGKLVYVE